MSSFTTAIKLLKQPREFIQACWMWISPIVPDRLYLKVLFKLRMGYSLNLNNPRTFAEKCQWLKLYDRKPIYHQMVDKYDAKLLVEKIIGKQYIIPTYGVWDRVEDIDWESLPEKFVIKPTHTGGSNCIIVCRNKQQFDVEDAKKRLQKVMVSNWIWDKLREWTYKDVKPRIIAEKLLEDEVHPYPVDYKIMCFGGEPKCFYVNWGRGQGRIQNPFFDIEGNYIKDLDLVNYEGDPCHLPPIPDTLPKMIEIARVLSKDHSHLRVDLYEVNGELFFGELTFAEESGFAKFKPDQWNYTFGDWITLPKEKME